MRGQRRGGIEGAFLTFKDQMRLILCHTLMVARTNLSTAARRLFATTHWTVVLSAGERNRESLAALCETYRGALLAYLRCLGRDQDEASDLVQGFFEHLLARDFLCGVSPAKGRFRTFLIASLKNYVCDQHDRHMAEKRGGGRPVASLEAVTDPAHPALQVPDPAISPDRAFDRAWAETTLAQALGRLRQECAEAGREDLFTAIEPMMHEDGDAPSYREAARRLAMTEGAVRVAAKRLRDRLRYLIREEVRQTTADGGDWEAELRYLVELFGR
jgi:RNA polymerase sigma factor (sigma-70 family)